MKQISVGETIDYTITISKLITRLLSGFMSSLDWRMLLGKGGNALIQVWCRMYHLHIIERSFGVYHTIKAIPELSILRRLICHLGPIIHTRRRRLILCLICSMDRHIILNLLLQQQVQQDRQKCRHREPSLHHEHNGIEEALFRSVVARIRKHVLEPLRDQRGAKPQRHGRREDEAVPPREWNGGDDPDAGDDHGGEEKGRHPAEHRGWDGHQSGGEFGEYPHDDEKKARGVASFAVRTPRQSDDTVVLSEYRHGRDGAKPRQEAVDAVRQDPSLDAGIEEFPIDGKARNIACRGDIANGFHHQNDVNSQERENDRPIHTQRIRFVPDEWGSWRRSDSGGREVAGSPGDNATHEKPKHHRAWFHDRAAKTFTNDDTHKHRETQTNVFGAPPGKSMGRSNAGTDREWTSLWTVDAAWAPCATRPVLKPTLDQTKADQSHRRTGHQRREDFLQQGRPSERKCYLEQGTAATGAKNSAISSGTW